MKSLLTCFVALALLFAVGCGGDNKSDACGTGCGPATADDGAPATPPAKTTGGDAKMITYKCSCGQEKTVPANSPPPS